MRKIVKDILTRQISDRLGVYMQPRQNSATT
jgi:hypothetical protein